jgi:Domain of unknown function (DUF4129)
VASLRFPPQQLPPPEVSSEEARRAADEVLARPEFQEQEGVLQRVVEWLRDLLSFGRPQEPPEPGTVDLGWLGSLLGWLLVLALIGLAVFLIVRYIRFGRGRRRPEPEDAVDVEEEERSAAEWQGDADELEAAGRWKEAMVARYQGLVLGLVERSVLQPVPGRTSGEYGDDVAEVLPEVTEPFDEATELFERAWYGDLPTGPDESARFRAAAARVLEEAGTT